MIKSIYTYIRRRSAIVWSFDGLINSIVYWFRGAIKKSEILFYCHDVHRYVVKDGRLYSPLIDVVHEHIGLNNGVSCVAPFSSLTSKQCEIEVNNFNFPILIGIVLRIFRYGRMRLVRLESDPLVYAYIYIFRRVHCKVIVAIQPSIEMCLAANKLGLRIYDLQHGVIGDSGYYSLDKRQKFNQRGWPDAVLCWDSISQQRLYRNTKGIMRGVVVGHPVYSTQMGRKLLEYKGTPQSNRNSSRLTILVSLTWHDYGVEFDDEHYSLLGIPAEVIELIKSTESVNFRIRLHPVQNRFSKSRIITELSGIFNGYSNVNYEDYNDCYIGAALIGCVGHISVASAAAIEAWQIGIRTILVEGYPPLTKEVVQGYFRDYIDAHLVKQVTRSEFLRLTAEDLGQFFISNGSIFEDSILSDVNEENVLRNLIVNGVC